MSQVVTCVTASTINRHIVNGKVGRCGKGWKNPNERTGAARTYVRGCLITIINRGNPYIGRDAGWHGIKKAEAPHGAGWELVRRYEDLREVLFQVGNQPAATAGELAAGEVV